MQSQPNEENPEETVTEESLMKKFKKIRGIKTLLQKGILLYVVLLDGDTPKWVKAIATAALAYLINPVDAIPDAIPVVGYSDDLAVIIAALASIKENIKAHHHEQATDIYNTL